jgi:hypothetical protein
LFHLCSTTIQNAFQRVLNVQLDALHASVDSLQLLDATLPIRFNDARAAQAAAFQDISVARAQANVASDQAAASVAVALQNAQVGTCTARLHLQSEKLAVVCGRDDYSSNVFKVECVHALNGLVLPRASHPGRLTPLAVHACGNSSPFCARCHHRNRNS